MNFRMLAFSGALSVVLFHLVAQDLVRAEAPRLDNSAASLLVHGSSAADLSASNAPPSVPPGKLKRVVPPLPSVLPGTAAPLKPGIYETRPYTCIVVVPGPIKDDRAILGSRNRFDRGGKMPQNVPDLEFIPRGNKN